jgi:hypothetical protein
VAAGERLPGTLAGRATRLLHDAGELDPAAPMSRALSPGEDPERGASWIEGFVGDSGLVLVHDPELLAVLDGWVASVPPETLRRDEGSDPLSSDRLDAERARGALETVARLLGSVENR